MAVGDATRLVRSVENALAAKAQHLGNQPVATAAQPANLFGRPTTHVHLCPENRS
jgi:hypothetical protein